MSSNSPNKRASTSVSEREREKRAAAKARRQAARTTMPVHEASSQPEVMLAEDAIPEGATVRTKHPDTATPRREARPAVSAPKPHAEPDLPAIPMGDPHGLVAMWTAFVLLAMLALLVMMIVMAS